MERLIRVQMAALDLAEVVDDLVRDVETVADSMPQSTKRAHQLDLAMRARQLSLAVRAAVAETRHRGGLDRRRLTHRRQEPQTAAMPPATSEKRIEATERRQGDRRRQT
jgi:hypothetical protein